MCEESRVLRHKLKRSVLPSNWAKPDTPNSRPYRQEAGPGDSSCQPLVRTGKGRCMAWDQLTRPEPSVVRSGTIYNQQEASP